MQWRRLGSVGATDAQRDRAFLDRYIGGFVHDGGSIGGGAVVGGIAAALARWRGRVPGSIADDLHDAHPMEREATTLAAAFMAATSLPAIGWAQSSTT